MIEVVSAIIVRHGRIFLQQRPALKDFGFCWEFLHFYTVGDRYIGQPYPKESQPGGGWFSVDEMLALNLSPANARARWAISDRIHFEALR